MAMSLNLNQPWTSDDDLVQWFDVVYESPQEQGHDERLKQLSWARDEILKWRVRSSNVNTLELETMSLFLTAEIHSMESKKSETDFDTHRVATLYSAGVVRFCEVLRHYVASEDGDGMTRCSNTRPLMRKLAESLDIPSWIIDLRHDACHSRTPPLTLLKQASFIAQNWLRVNFWTPRICKAEDFDFDRMIRTLEGYSNKSPLEVESHVVSLVRSNYHKTLRVVVHLLTTSIPSTETDVIFQDLTLPPTGTDVIFQDLTLPPTGTDVIFQDLTLPPVVRKRFSPLIMLVFKCNLVHELLHLLINSSHQDDHVNISSVIWFKELVSSFYGQEEESNKPAFPLQEISSKLKTSPSLQVVFLRIVHHLTNNPFKLTPPLIQMFVTLFKGTKYHDMIQKLAIFASLLVGSNGLMNGSVKNAEFQIKNVDCLKRHLSTKHEKTKRVKRVKFSF